MMQKGGNERSTFVNVARLIFKKMKRGKFDIYNNIIFRIMASSVKIIKQKMKNDKNVSYSHMVTCLLDDRYECVKRLIG